MKKNTVQFAIAGTAYENRQEILQEISQKVNFAKGIKVSVDLILEPDNIHDPSAVKVMYNNKCLGYVPRSATHRFDGNEKGQIISFHGKVPWLGAIVKVEKHKKLVLRSRYDEFPENPDDFGHE